MKVKSTSFEFEYQNKTFTCECSFKTGIKRYNFRIRNNVLFVTAPYLTSVNKIKQLIDKEISSKFLNQLLVSEQKLKEEENNIYVLGVKYPIDLLKVDSNILGFTYKNKEYFSSNLKKYALKVFEQRVRHYEQIMNVAKPYNIRVRDMKTRFGTNSRKTYTICLSLKLIHYNIDVIDSVVIHELAHHFHFDHSDKFYRVLYKYCPLYEELKKILRKGVYQ